MKHLHELPIPVLCDLFTRPWNVNEKFDGSYMRAGFDDTGRFYTERKGHHTRCYHVDDWDDKPWTNAFRGAHLALETVLVDHLYGRQVNATEIFGNGDFLDCEIMYGAMPNAVLYHNELTTSKLNSIIINGMSKAVPDSAIVRRERWIAFKSSYNLDISSIQIRTKIWFSEDGTSLEKVDQDQEWAILYNTPQWMQVSDFWGKHEKSLFDIEKWLSRMLFVNCTYHISRYELLTVKLNKKPDFINDADWADNRKAIVAALKEEREKLSKQLQMYCNVFARVLKYQFHYPTWQNQYRPSEHEGLVIYAPANTPQGKAISCKVVDKEHFAPLNNFAHIVRYWLQGGRRPERPSFMSRTQEWPVEKRLARLEVLRQRYVRGKDRIKLSNRFSELNYRDCKELDQRTLLLFAELKQRIINGRSSVQSENSQD